MQLSSNLALGYTLQNRAGQNHVATEHRKPGKGKRATSRQHGSNKAMGFTWPNDTEPHAGYSRTALQPTPGAEPASRLGTAGYRRAAAYTPTQWRLRTPDRHLPGPGNAAAAARSSRRGRGRGGDTSHWQRGGGLVLCLERLHSAWGAVPRGRGGRGSNDRVPTDRSWGRRAAARQVLARQPAGQLLPASPRRGQVRGGRGVPSRCWVAESRWNAAGG